MIHSKFDWSLFIQSFEKSLPDFQQNYPWEITTRATEIVLSMIAFQNDEYHIKDGIAIHKTACIEPHSIIKAPAFIGPNCFVASHTYIRNGVVLFGNNSVGPGCEVKSSFIFQHSNLAHFNFVGDSIIGSNVNFEAGAIIANHFNEREDKLIRVTIGSEIIHTGVEKFGALVADGCKIGANAVLSPGTILPKNSIVNRLQLIELRASEQKE
jgi:UDP-N-acetylglucosamine diphosphorylase / glucose-1-phosphate thymidylyltransferase / UDP-N-acetylgalactosamine diphosphorylase / glucosamine-1-phosphate N-acetyltransferase / galactosamine-1-phosphate N-acetyltransferase